VQIETFIITDYAPLLTFMSSPASLQLNQMLLHSRHKKDESLHSQ